MFSVCKHKIHVESFVCVSVFLKKNPRGLVVEDNEHLGFRSDSASSHNVLNRWQKQYHYLKPLR